MVGVWGHKGKLGGVRKETGNPYGPFPLLQPHIWKLQPHLPPVHICFSLLVCSSALGRKYLKYLALEKEDEVIFKQQKVQFILLKKGGWDSIKRS